MADPRLPADVRALPDASHEQPCFCTPCALKRLWNDREPKARGSDDVRVEDMSGQGVGPWKLHVGGYGVAQWPSKPAVYDPEGYAEEVARVLRVALESASTRPAGAVRRSVSAQDAIDLEAFALVVEQCAIPRTRELVAAENLRNLAQRIRLDARAGAGDGGMTDREVAEYDAAVLAVRRDEDGGLNPEALDEAAHEIDDQFCCDTDEPGGYYFQKRALAKAVVATYVAVILKGAAEEAALRPTISEHESAGAVPLDVLRNPAWPFMRTLATNRVFKLADRISKAAPADVSKYDVAEHRALATFLWGPVRTSFEAPQAEEPKATPVSSSESSDVLAVREARTLESQTTSAHNTCNDV